jgi:hypothetical protein
MGTKTEECRTTFSSGAQKAAPAEEHVGNITTKLDFEESCVSDSEEHHI